jgi:hypothetical protein
MGWNHKMHMTDFKDKMDSQDSLGTSGLIRMWGSQMVRFRKKLITQPVRTTASK